MDRSIPLLIIGLVFGAGLGFTFAAANGITLDGHDHGEHAGHGAAAMASGGADHQAHDHDTPLVLPQDADAPSLKLELHRDPSSGWNLHLITRNFAFAPENASGAHVPGQGHAHVYVNGVKLGRYYGPWLHLDNLPLGEVRVRVTLNANDHRVLQVGGERLSETLTIGN